MATDYQAVLECIEDPCTYCHQPKRKFVVAHPLGPFNTADAALEHGRGMATKVYGSSAHHITLQSRTVTEWGDDVDAMREAAGRALERSRLKFAGLGE